LDGEAATETIHVRVTLRRKLAYSLAAGQMGLSRWLTKTLDKAAGYKPKH
jgi:hypothetical protein